MAVWHTLLQDPGLLQAIVDGLYASEVWRFSHACRVALQSVSYEGRLCCPHVYPSRGTTLSSALRCCQLQQLKSIRLKAGVMAYSCLTPLPMTELDSDPFLQDLVERLALCSSLEELGPISIDEGGGPYGPEDEVRNRSRPLPAETRCMFSNSSLLPALGNAFEHLRSLERVTLTLRCVHDENEIGSSLIAAIGSCKALKQLRLDLDTTMSSGGEMLAAVAQMLHELGPERRLQSLTLGYSWFSEASDETLHELQAAISVLPLHFVGLLAPQDPEMGSLENACSVLGRTVEEVLVMDGWDHDGLVFPVFLEALCQCPRLKRLHLIGEVPEKLDVESFEQTLRARVSGLPEVCVNCPLGIKIANHTLG